MSLTSAHTRRIYTLLYTHVAPSTQQLQPITQYQLRLSEFEVAVLPFLPGRVPCSSNKPVNVNLSTETTLVSCSPRILLSASIFPPDTLSMHYTHNSDCAERSNAQYRLLCISPGVVLNMQGLWENKKSLEYQANCRRVFWRKCSCLDSWTGDSSLQIRA